MLPHGHDVAPPPGGAPVSVGRQDLRGTHVREEQTADRWCPAHPLALCTASKVKNSVAVFQFSKNKGLRASEIKVKMVA